MRRHPAPAFTLLVLAAAGCANLSGDYYDPSRLHRPQNDGANAGTRDLHVRNAFLLRDQEQVSAAPQASPAGGLPLYAVLVNERDRPVRLERVTPRGGGTARLNGTIEVPAGGVAGTDRPIATVTGVSEGWVAMTFTLDGTELPVMVPVHLRAGMYATYGTAEPQQSPSPSPTGSPAPTPFPAATE